MNYELARQLKNAGFQWDERNSFSDSGSEPRYEMYPTLSELIEACGDIQIRIVGYWSGNNKEWQADNGGFMGQNNIEGGIAETGSTPEEAVAKLWLAINKK